MSNVATNVRRRNPRVSVIIPMRNEEGWIERCLDSLRANDYPAGRLEFIVVDGVSNDRSCAIVSKISESDPRVKLLNNPFATTPHALNIGIASARGTIVVRADSHATYAPDYISRSVAMLLETNAGAVGGRQNPVGETPIGRAIAAAMRSKFGSGAAKYRTATRTQEAETVYLGAWFRKTLLDVGGFNEGWIINQDYELNVRLRDSGYRVILCPDIRSDYFVRPSISALIRQHYRYGIGRFQTLRAYPHSLRTRQLAAPIFVLMLAMTIGMIPIHSGPFLALAAIYEAATFAAATIAAKSGGWALLPRLLVVFPALHLSWGVGFWRGLMISARHAR